MSPAPHDTPVAERGGPQRQRRSGRTSPVDSNSAASQHCDPSHPPARTPAQVKRLELRRRRALQNIFQGQNISGVWSY